MDNADWKRRFIDKHNLKHINPDIVYFLLDQPDIATAEEVQAAAKAIETQSFNRQFADGGEDGEDGSDDYNSWSARIGAAAAQAGDDDASLSIEGQSPKLLVPLQVRQTLEAEVASAADVLRSLRSLIEKEQKQAKANARPTSRSLQVRMFIEPRPANWAEWLAKPSWTAVEMAALLLNFEPGDITSAKLRRLRPPVGFEDKLDDVIRHVGAGHLIDPATPDAVRKWASTYEPGAPVELMRKPEPISKNAGANSDYIHHHTRALYQKTLLYLAVKYYGYDIDAAMKNSNVKESVNGGVGANSVAAKMESDLDKAGVSVSAKKLSEHLNKAVTDLIGSGRQKVSREKLRAARKGFSK